MRNIGIVVGLLMVTAVGCTTVQAAPPEQKLFMDVHEFGKVSAHGLIPASVGQVAEGH